jgi:hypothetical protein
VAHWVLRKSRRLLCWLSFLSFAVLQAVCTVLFAVDLDS